MSKTEKIIRHLPQFYQAWDRHSLIYQFIDPFGQELTHFENALIEVLKSHTIDYADIGMKRINDLGRLGALFDIKPEENEEVEQFRRRLKAIVQLYKRGLGTAEAIARMTALNFNLVLDKIVLPNDPGYQTDEYTTLAFLKGDEETIQIEIVDNPIKIAFHYKRGVRSGEDWGIENKGVTEAIPEITIIGIGVRTVNPILLNVTTRKLIGYRGVVPNGAYLVIKYDPNQGVYARLNGQDVTEKLYSIRGEAFNEARFGRARFGKKDHFPVIPPLTKGKSIWRYLTLPAYFDFACFNHDAFTQIYPVGEWNESSFDSAIFAPEPSANLSFKWKERQRASFMVRLPWEILAISGLKATGAKFDQSHFNASYFVQDPRMFLFDAINQVKAAGVKTIVNYYFLHTPLKNEVQLLHEVMPQFKMSLHTIEENLQEESIILNSLFQKKEENHLKEGALNFGGIFNVTRLGNSFFQ